jgi:hypothetical protein
MLNIFKKNKQINDLLKNSNLTTKITIYFSTKTYGEDYDSREKNFTYTNLNPQTIKGYVRDIKPESLFWRQIGVSETGAKEVICEEKYGDWFRTCNKIEIDGDEFHVYKENVGNRVLITKLPFKLIKCVLTKVN